MAETQVQAPRVLYLAQLITTQPATARQQNLGYFLVFPLSEVCSYGKDMGEVQELLVWSFLNRFSAPSKGDRMARESSCALPGLPGHLMRTEGGGAHCGTDAHRAVTLSLCPHPTPGLSTRVSQSCTPRALVRYCLSGDGFVSRTVVRGKACLTTTACLLPHTSLRLAAHS